MDSFIRLQKYLAAAGVASRRAAEKLISEGRVKVNGLAIRELGTKVDPRKDIVEVNGEIVKLAASPKYYLLHKPPGYLTTVRDPFSRPTVMDLLPKGERKGLFPVGRLDIDSEGLLLITNDGELAFRLTHPRFKIPKTYRVRVSGKPSREDLNKLERGIALEEGVTAPAKVRMLSASKNKREALLEITLHEGKKRQIKRMCAQIGYPVLSLKRISLGFLNLKGLSPGSYRKLKEKEVEKLRRLVGLN